MMHQMTLSSGATHYVRADSWKRQVQDTRDEAYRVKLHPAFLQGVPTSLDLRNNCSPISSQGSLGSCTSHMRAALVEYNEHVAVTKSIKAAVSAQVAVSNVQVSATGVISFSTSVTPPTSTPVPPP